MCLENKDKIIDGIVGFRTKDLMNYTTIQSRVGLRNTDTKRIWDRINTYAYDHYAICAALVKQKIFVNIKEICQLLMM